MKGRAHVQRALACFAFVAALVGASALCAQADDDARLETVLAPFAEVQALSARFEEEKRVALLKQPLRSRGELYYARPYRLARHTREPVPSRLVVTRERLTVVDATGAQQLELASQPEVAALVDALMLVFEGDARRLRRLMRHELTVDDQGFRLELVPREAKLAKLIREMTVAGKGAVLASVSITDGLGDVTVTRFHDVKLRAPFTAAEKAKLFSEKP